MAMLDYAAALAQKNVFKRGKTADQKLAIDYLIPKGVFGVCFSTRRTSSMMQF